VDVTITPAGTPAFKLVAGVSRRTIAPGAEEFLPPTGGGLWLPPERTFSSVSVRRGFVPERVDHVEVGAEREWSGDFVVAVRAFHERVDDQLVTLFDLSLPGAPSAPIGHYYVASAGIVEARGWGVRVSRTLGRAHATVDYASVDARWIGQSPDAAALLVASVPVRRSDTERFHDLTTALEGSVPGPDTRVIAVVKLNSRLLDTAFGGAPRFNVQVNQALPFVTLGGAQWEMIVAVRSLFHEDLREASVYDEVLVARPPKRIIGGVTVRF
jgi:hypothetical protein